MVLRDDGRFEQRVVWRREPLGIEMQRGEHDQVAGALFEHGIEVPDLEMAAHADQQRPLADAAPRPHPRRDPEPPLAVHRCRGDEPEPSAQQRVARAAFPVVACRVHELLVPIDDIVPIIHQQAWIIGVKPDEQVFACTASLYRYAEMFGKTEFASRADRRDRTSHEEFVHDACILNANTQSRDILVASSCDTGLDIFVDPVLVKS